MIYKMRKRIRDTFIPHSHNQGKPHILKKKLLFFFSLIIISGLVGIFSITDRTNLTRLGATIYSSLLIDLTNKNRNNDSLPPLVINEKLEQAATLKAKDMAEKNYFAHTSPEGLDSWHWFKQVGYVFIYAGENLAVNFDDSENLADAWMNSPTHRANILNNKFTEIGIATYDGVYKGSPSTFVVQMFGKPLIPTTTTAQAPDTKPVVLGTTKVISATQEETRQFIAVENSSITIPVETASPTIATSLSEKSYTPWYQKLLIELSGPLGIILIVVGSLLTISLILSIGYHKKISQRITFASLVALVIIVSGITYLSVAQDFSVLQANVNQLSW